MGQVKRPDAARMAIGRYTSQVPGEHREPLQTQLTDLLADLMQLCNQEADLNWAEAHIAAANHYRDENLEDDLTDALDNGDVDGSPHQAWCA